MKIIKLLFCLLCFVLFFAGVMKVQLTQIRVACVGDSITEGSALGQQTYPLKLGQLLGDHYEVRNFGIGGTTLLKKGDFPYWDRTTFFEVQDFQPHIIVLMLGTNDSKPQNWIYKDEFASDYLEMIGVFRSINKNVHIFVCEPPPVFQDGYGITNAVIRDEIIPLIKTIRRTAATDSIDLNTPMLDKAIYFYDGIHPNAAGASFIANIVKDAILNSASGIIRYFAAQPAVFEKDGSCTLYWETVANSNATLNGTPVQDIDSLIVHPLETTENALITNGTVSDTAKVTLTYIPPGQVKSFTAFPYFLDLDSGDSTTLTWSATNGSLVTLDGVSVERNGSQPVAPLETHTYSLVATGDVQDTARVTVSVLPSEKINRCYQHAVEAYVTERGYQAEWAVDGDSTTAWKSSTGSSQWIQVDLGGYWDINRVVLRWGETYGMLYHLQVPDQNGQMRKRLYSNSAGDGGVDDITGLSGTTRFIRITTITKSNPDSGLVFKEFEVYGTKSSSTSIEKTIQSLPVQFELEQNYPNPFNPTTRIRWRLIAGGKISLGIYDTLGREVAVLADGYHPAGSYRADFNADNLPSGVYLCQLKAGSRMESRKMLLLR
jgi:acyl-CoA thioesterase-1